MSRSSGGKPSATPSADTTAEQVQDRPAGLSGRAMKRLLCVIVGHRWGWSGPRKTTCDRCGMDAYWLPWSDPIGG